jgi:hypothetical protein
MGKLHFPPDAQLTGPDRLILGFLEKDYEAYDQAKEGTPSDVADESDDSATKRTEFVSPSPEGRLKIRRWIEIHCSHHRRLSGLRAAVYCLYEGSEQP